MGKIVLLELYAGQHFGLNYAKERAVADAPIYIWKAQATQHCRH